MGLLKAREFDNAEGYCPKCGAPLGISGVCYSCIQDARDEAEENHVNLLLRKMTVCSICGLPKVHHRLHGYLCRNPEHNK